MIAIFHSASSFFYSDPCGVPVESHCFRLQFGKQQTKVGRCVPTLHNVSA